MQITLIVMRWALASLSNVTGPWWRSLAVCVVTIAVLCGAHALLARLLVESDLLAALLARQGLVSAAGALLLLALRLFLVFVAPAWLLVVLLRTAATLLRAQRLRRRR